MQGMEIDCLPWSPFASLHPHVIAMQREKMSTTQQEARETGTCSTGMYETVHPLLKLKTIFDLANHMANTHKIYYNCCIFQNLWQMQHKSNFFFRQWRSFQYIPVCATYIPHSTHPMASVIDLLFNGIILGVARKIKCK
jgi:hypothetical protein